MFNDFDDAIFTLTNQQPNPDNINLGKTSLDELPIGMSYVPMQKWRKVYEPDVGLDRGTLFSELDMPFLGRRAVK